MKASLFVFVLVWIICTCMLRLRQSLSVFFGLLHMLLEDLSLLTLTALVRMCVLMSKG